MNSACLFREDMTAFYERLTVTIGTNQASKEKATRPCPLFGNGHPSHRGTCAKQTRRNYAKKEVMKGTGGVVPYITLSLCPSPA